MGKLPTMRVKVKATGHECTINESDFNSEVHKRCRQKLEDVEPDPEPTKSPTRALIAADLAKMTSAELKKLPEWELIDGRSRLSTKDDIIGALMVAAAGDAEEDEDPESEETED